MDFGKWALKNSKLVMFLVVVLVIGGLYSVWDMSKLEDPEITVKEAMVVTPYPGASSHEVELEVTDELEKSIRSMSDLFEVTSRSMNDVSIINVRLKSTVPDKEVEQRWDILRRKVGDIQTSLPSGARKSIVLDNFGDVYGMFYAMTSDGFSDREMNDYAEYVKREVQNIEGISDVAIYGARRECIYIELMQDKMANMGVHPVEVLSTLNGQNQTTYSGYFENGDNRIRVAVNDRYKKSEDIENLLLQGHEKDQLRLKDIAKVKIGYAEPIRNEMFYDEQRAFGISISAEEGTDITKLGKAVDEKLNTLRDSKIPEGINFHKVFYQPERVVDSLSSFVINLIESILIVIIVLMFTMGVRSGVIIGVNLLVIVFGTFLVLLTFDGTLQRVSLASFVVAMGMLVDNAIVIIDGILVDLKRGVPRKEALTAIGKKTGMPLLGATLIAILAFFPIFLSPDTAGVYVRDLFIVLAVSLLLSWMLALTLVPIQASRYLKKTGKEEDENKDPFDSKYYRRLRRVLSWTLHHKFISISVAVLLLASSIGCYFLLPQGFFPDMDYNQLYIEYKLPEGVTSQRVKNDLFEIEDYLEQRDDISHVTVSVGGTPSRYNLVRSIAVPSMSYGELIVDYTDSKKLVASIQEIQNYLNDTYPDAYIRLKRYNLMYKKYPIELQFNGPDPEVLKKLTQQALDIMREDSMTMLECSDWEPEKPALVIDYNQPVARSLGLTRSDVAMSLLAATEGIPTGTFYDNGYKQTIYFKCVNDEGEQIEDLSNASVFGMLPPVSNIANKETIAGLMTGSLSEEDVISEMMRTVPLSQATNGVKIEWQEPVVIRYNGQRAMRAQCEPYFGESVETARKSIAKKIEKIELPVGYSMQWEGEHRASTDATKYLFQSFPLAIVLMLAILILLFKDYRKPLIIICCIPLLFVGVVYGMLVSGKIFGFVAIVGILGLIGMMIKNGIILMDEINHQLEAGVEPLKALLDSSSSRFRPVMMASLTTILGMIPLLGDDLFGPLAVTIMAGLLVGTLITLLFIPILYAVFFRIKIEKK